MNYCRARSVSRRAARWGLAFVLAGASACFAPTEVYMDTDPASSTDGGSDPSASSTVSTTATTTTTASTTETSMTSTTVNPSTTDTADTTDSDPTSTTDSETDPTTGTETTDPSDTASSESTGGPPVCGDGDPEGDEECDDGNLINTDACKNDCTNALCGDGVVGPGEECDDGNQMNTDLCTNNCTDAECGDGFDQGAEQCDDGNLVDHDGCTSQCIEEPFCELFSDVDCPTGAMMFCDTAAITCDSIDDAIAACEACIGGDTDCQPFHEVNGCNEGDGVVDENSACPGRLNFVFDGDVCNNGIVIDDCDGGTLGTWCTP